MPTVDISNIIRRLAVITIRTLGSPLAVFTAFAVACAGLGTMVMGAFDVAAPSFESLRLPEQYDTQLPLVDMLLYVANIDMFVMVYNYFVTFIEKIVPFLAMFSVAYVASLIVYRNSLALRNHIASLITPQ